MAEITLAATVENLDTVTGFVSEQLDEMGCPLKVQVQFSIAVDEIFSNIARYAYPEGPGMAIVQVSSRQEGKQAMVTFIDQGIPYNPLEEEEPDITLSADERPIGGLGILMVKKSMDEVRYRFENGKNMLSIVKTIA